MQRKSSGTGRGSFAHGRGAFALVELVALIVVALLIVSLLAVAGQAAGKARLLGQDMAKLRTFGAATYAYALDHDDQIWTFTWKGGQTQNTPWPELNFAPNDVQAAANQAVYLMRTRAGRLDIPPITGWLAHNRHSHLVLADYFDLNLPWMLGISAADRDRLLWASDPEGFDQGRFQPCQPEGIPGALSRWPYSSSFMLVPAAWDRSEVGQRVSQANWWDLYFVPSTADLGPGLLTEVAHPSGKVLLYDERDRHSGWPNRAFAHPEARAPLLFADGRVRMKHTADANPGWIPNHPRAAQATWITFPDWFQQCEVGAPPPQVGPTTAAPGVYRWTRGGLAGRDFGGPEINTGQPQPLPGGDAMEDAGAVAPR